MTKEITGKKASDNGCLETLDIGKVATIEMEVAWRNEEDRAEAEKMAVKYRHGIAKGGMISGLPANQNAMLSLSWNDPDCFFKKHPDEWECNSGEGLLLKRKTLYKVKCRLKCVSDDGFGLSKEIGPINIENINSAIEAWMGNDYDAGNMDDIEYRQILSKLDGYADRGNIDNAVWRIMFNYLNKTITLDQFDKPGTYPDISFDIVEIKPLKQFLYKNVQVVKYLEFEKTGKQPAFLDQPEKSK